MSNLISSPVTKAAKKTLLELDVLPASRILVGVSGGIDSMVLITILKELGYNSSVAHVNFQLRGFESDEDAMLVRDWCALRDVPYFEHSVDTRQYADMHQLNTQAAAREIRYKWWNELISSIPFDFVATAHHRDDNIETFFINLLRGTGVKGLKGIPVRRDHFIRPILHVQRSEIESFAEEFDVPYRTDRSNDSDDYLRNRIRHHLIPFLRDFVPSMDSTMAHTLLRLGIEWEAYDLAYQNWKSLHIIEKEGAFYVEAVQIDYPFLLRWLEEKGMPWSLAYDYIKSPLAEKGKPIHYGDFSLSRTKDGFYFENIHDFDPVTIEKPGAYPFGNEELKIELVSPDQFQADHDRWVEYVSMDSIQWPLTLRQASPGDKFTPIGMAGRSKKVQDFLTDLKLDHYEKERVRILSSQNQIIWVIGKRLSEQNKVLPGDRNIYKLSYWQNNRMT